MKLWPIYSFFGLLIFLSIGAITKEQSTETLILGDWKEVSWKYEKVNHDNKIAFDINDYQKEEICKNLIIHEAETWRFSPNKKLEFLENGKIKEDLKWNIKGRGHVLELKHQNSIIEDYQVVDVTRDELIVQFNFDLQIRGIVRMTFKRIPNKQYAQKI